MKRSVKKHLSTLAAAVALTLVAATAWAYWSAGSVAGGNGAGAASSVNQGATPTANAVAQTVTVSWTATTLLSGQAVGGYQVKRYDSSTGVVQTILSACNVTITGLSCVESSVPLGSWKYTVTPRIGTNWVGQESSQSGTVTTTPPDTTAPSNAIAVSGVSGGVYKSVNTIYYRGLAAGSFTLTNAVTDAGSGPASSQTATLGNTPTNWTHTGSTVSTPAGGPYVSNVFSWTAGATSAPTEAVTGRDVAGNTAVTNLSYVNDSTAPSAGTISYLNGAQPGHSVPVTFTTGTDGGSGIATKQLQRQSAPLASGICGTYTGWSDRGADSPTSVYTDSAVDAGYCYKYRYVVTDRVGNQDIATSASESKVDYSGAVYTTAGLLSHWRLGEAATSLYAEDSFTAGANGALLSARSGETNASWTAMTGNTATLETFTWSTNTPGGQAIRRSSTVGAAVYYNTASPPSANYRVEADLVVKSLLAGEAVGVVARLNTTFTGSGTFYLAKYTFNGPGGNWDLIAQTNGAQTNLGSFAQTLVAGQIYHMALEVNGSTISLLIDGAVVATASNSTLTAAGRAGVRLSNSTNAGDASTGIHLDNYQVTPLPYPRAVDSKGSNTGDYKNGPTLGQTGALAGDSNTAVRFDGSNGHVQMTGTTGFPVGAAVRSTELWFKTSSAAKQALFRYGTGASAQEYGLWIEAGGSFMTAWGHSGTNDKTFTMPYAVNDGAWHHVVQTYNGTSLTLYIDGVGLTPQAAFRSTVMDQYGFTIGGIIRPNDSNSGLFFNGWIDEVSFYTSTLTQTDVTNHYQLGTVTVPEPVVAATIADLAYIENGTTAADSALLVTDADSSNLVAATVTMTTNYLNGQDTLAFVTQNGITGTWTAGTGVMALSGSATLAQYQTALRSITYNNNSDYPNTSTRTVTFSVSDGTNTSNTASRNITVTAVNDAPAGSPATLTVNEDDADSFAIADFGMYDTADNGAHSLLAVKMTTLPALGTLKLSGVNVTVGQVVSAANITSGLLTYTPPLNANGTGYTSFTFQAQDNGGTANGGIDLDASPNTITFNVTAVNDAPANTVPVAQTTIRNTAEVFSTANGSLISVADVDATTVQVQLVSTNGATTLFGTMPGSLTFSVGDGTADATMTFTGTKAAVNTALDGLSFNPTTNFTGAASLQIVSSDLGATGTGGILTDSDTVTITVAQDLGIFTAQQDIGGPGVAGSSSHSSGTYTVAGGGSDIWNNADQFQFLSMPMTGDGRLTAKVVSQTQTPTTSNPAKAGVMFRETLAAGSIHGMADFMKANGSEFHWRLTTNGPSGATTVTTGIAAPYWVRITRVGNLITGERSPDGVTWTQQGVSQSIPMTSSIYVGLAVSAVDNAKLNTATFSNVTFEQPPVLAASGGTTAHTENVPVVVDSGIAVTDTTSANMASGTVTIGSGYTAGQDVLAFTNQNGITGSWSAPTLTLTGSATKAQWQTALQSITYSNTSNAPNTGNRTINFVVNDGIFTSNTAAKAVSIAAVNDAPVNSMPGAQTTNMNTAKVFSSGGGNLISVTDADAAGGTMQVQLVSTNGATTLSTLSGLSFSVGDGTADATMTFTGSFAAVNTALSGLSFNPTTSFTGAASLQIVTADQGNTGSGGTLTDSDTVAITVANGLGIFTANQDIGGPSIAGSSSFSAGTYTVSGSGADIWGNADQFQYLTVPMTGDGRLTARVVTDTNPHAGAKAGVMMRNSLTAGSVHAFMDVMAANGTEFMARTVDSQTPSYAVSTPGLAAPYWVRITRVGNTFKGERSSDGVTWTQEGTTQTVTMGSTIYVGLAVGAHTNAALHTATFDNVAITAAPTYFDTIWGESSLVNYFRMDDSTGTAIDDLEVVNNNGTYFGSPTKSQAGAIAGNNAVLFDGVDDYGSIARQIQDDFSIEFWFKSNQNAGATCTQWWNGMRLVDAEVSGGNSDFGVSLCQGKIIGGIGNTSDVSIVSPLTYNNNAWHHVVFTRTKTAAAMQLYVDGALVVSGTPNNTGTLSASTVITFGRAPGGGSFYQGLLDEIALYDTVLSAGQVTSHYNAAP